jgi:hypothetical protein
VERQTEMVTYELPHALAAENETGRSTAEQLRASAVAFSIATAQWPAPFSGAENVSQDGYLLA